MIPVPERRSGTELLDIPEEQKDDAEFERGMSDIRAVNFYLGGTRSIVKHLSDYTRDRPERERSFTLLDMSAGTGDIPAAAVKWARKRGISIFITAVDINQRVLNYAARFLRGEPEIKLIKGDAFRLPFRDKTFDIVICSLTLHHFTEAEALELIKKARSLARRGIIIGDLRRSWVSFFLFRAVAAIFFRNRFTRHDGPLSILKSFTPEELEGLAARAGLKDYKVHKHLFWRMTLTAKA